MITSLVDKLKSQYQSAALYDRAIFRIEINYIDFTEIIQKRLLSLRISDHRGLVADSLELELSDTDGRLAIPPEDASIRVWIGWESTGLVYKGEYLVTGVTHSGPPDKIGIAAEAADLADQFRQKKERSWNMIFLPDIIGEIAASYHLTPLIHDSFDLYEIAHIDQNESDANLITRLADEYDAVATVKNGNLLFMPRGAAQSASGLEIPIMFVKRSSGDGHYYRAGDGTDRIDGVKAFYYDTDKAKKNHVIVGLVQEGNIKELRYTCRDKQSAELAANAEFNRCKRSAKSLSLNLSRGMPELIPEQQIVVDGFKPEIDELIWLGTTVTHTIDASSGFVTSLECEIQLPDSDAISQLFDGSIEREEIDYSKFTGVTAVYKDEKRNKQTFTLGDQSNPLKLKHIYETKNSAENACYREYNRIREAANQPAIEKPKKPKKENLTRQEKTAKAKEKYASYSGVKTWYKDAKGKDQMIVLGEQSKPLIKEHVYVTKKAADAWAQREYKKIKAAKAK